MQSPLYDVEGFATISDFKGNLNEHDNSKDT
jgi:hypothetical protein